MCNNCECPGVGLEGKRCLDQSILMWGRVVGKERSRWVLIKRKLENSADTGDGKSPLFSVR